jgi:hypothetical protein
MKGTILDFLKLASEKPELAQELVDLAAKHDFQFSDEVSDEELEGIAGGSGPIQSVSGVSGDGGSMESLEPPPSGYLQESELKDGSVVRTFTPPKPRPPSIDADTTSP